MELLPLSEEKIVHFSTFHGRTSFVLCDKGAGTKITLTSNEIERLSEGLKILKSMPDNKRTRRRQHCNWCATKLGASDCEKYCQNCSDIKYKECKRCHRPFPDERFFELDAERCNACQRKYLKVREKRSGSNSVSEKWNKRPKVVMSEEEDEM